MIKTCDSICSFSNVIEKPSACLGVYYNHSGEIMIKQLGMISSDEQCLTSKECILEIDSFNSQSFSCCCSTNNCTLNWKNIPTTTITHRSILMNNRTMKTVMNIEQNHFSWKLFLIIFLFLLIIILIMFTLILSRSLTNQHEHKDNKSLIEPSSAIEQLFSSAQQIILGKNSIIYQAIWENDIIAMKVYKQTNFLIWKNEVTLLKSIKHESIIKYVRFGRRKKSIDNFLLDF